MLCRHCGAENPDDTLVCKNCEKPLLSASSGAGATVGEKTEKPSSYTDSEVYVAGYRVARLGDRLLAIILDSILFAVFFALIGSWIASRWGGWTEQGFSLEGTPAAVTIGLTLLFAFCYHWLLEGYWGATPGKKIVGVEIRDKSGSSINLKQSLVRNLLRIIDGLGVYLLGFLIALFSKYHQRIGDFAGKTVVIEKSPGTALRAILVATWLGAIFSGGWGAYAIHEHFSAPLKVSGADRSSRMPSGGSTETPPKAGSGDLKIAGFEFLTSKDGPARAAAPYKPGDHVYSQYNIIGYATNDQGQVKLQGSVVVTDPDNLKLFDGTFDVNQIASSHKPVMGWLNFPLREFVPPGVCKLNIKIHDVTNNKDIEHLETLTVKGTPPAAAKSLELRDMKLSLTEDGPPLESPVVKPGDSIHMSAKLAGMQFINDSVKIRVAFQLIGPNDEVILDEPNFISLEESFSYHPPGFYIPVSAKVRTPSVPKGLLTERYVLTDLNANARETRTITFRSE